jgi:hypothetical protein
MLALHNQIFFHSRMEDDQNNAVIQANENIDPTLDSEIEAEVWNAPRPEELSIPLDSTKTEQVKLWLFSMLENVWV